MKTIFTFILSLLRSTIATLITISLLIISLPSTTPFRTPLHQFLTPLFTHTALDQQWNMFAPNPMQDDVLVALIAHYQDGSTKRIEFDELAKTPERGRYFQERWRKFLTDVLRLDASEYLWPQATDYLETLVPQTVHNPMIRLELERRWRTARRPPEPRLVADDPWERHIFYVRDYQSEEEDE
jgi:hypothetical protein